MVVGSSNDFSAQCMVSGNVNSAIIPNKTSVHPHAAIMVEGAGDGVIPEMNVSGGGFYVLMGLLHGGHDHCFEMFWGQHYYLVIVVLTLIMICSS